MPIDVAPRLFASGLSWPEAPRWHNGRLWISDVWNFRLVSIGSDGTVQTVARVEGRPSGMDFDAAGQICMATGGSRQILSIDPASGTVQVVHDLEEAVTGALNDMILGPEGWGWVGDTGFLFGKDEPKNIGKIFAHHPQHGVKIVANEVFFPNGMVISPDGKTLYVNATFGKEILAFEIAADGALTNRRVHAEVPGSPDGLCMDADGFLWVPLLFEHKFVRVSPQGTVTHEIAFPGMHAISCVFGGEDRGDLFMCVSSIDNSDPANIIREGEVHVIRLDAGGCGRP